jgi:hypothetical protein
MAATMTDIMEWLERGKEAGATHVVIVCDTLDWNNYPVFVTPTDKVEEIIDRYNFKNMQKIMEVYNLSASIEEQLSERKAWHL